MANHEPVDFVSHGSVKLPIYYSPLKKRSKTSDRSGEGNGSSALTNDSEIVLKTYDSYVAVWHEGEPSRRRRCRAPSIKLVKRKGKKVAKRLAQQGSQIVELSPEDRRVYISAREILQPHQLEVDAAARLLHDLLQRLEGFSLQQAVDFFNAHGRKVILGTLTPAAVDIYLADLKPRVGIHHFRDVRKFLIPFGRAFPGEVAAVTTQQIDKWLGKLGGKARNKNNARDRLITFFTFLQRKAYLPKNIEHPAKATTAFKDPREVITCEEQAAATALGLQIYTPEEMRLILTEPDLDVRVTLELKAFSGIRTEELVRLWWVLVREDTGYINVTEAIAKLNQRAVPILENLKRRLAAYPATEKHDKVSKRWGSSNSLYHAWKRATDRVGLPYRKNGFRSSYISYRLAQINDINRVATESGNSPEVIKKDYQEFATPQQAAEWFSI
jgi:hypothetical protein